MDKDKIYEDVRWITDYPEEVFSDIEVYQGIDFTIRDLEARIGDDETALEEFQESFEGEQAVMWATCYHLKVKSGEIGSLPMSIGDVDMQTVIRNGMYNEAAVGVIDWIEQFERYFAKFSQEGGYGMISGSRTDRSYEVPTDDFFE